MATTFTQKFEYKRYAEYHLRWQISAFIMIPIMYFLKKIQIELWLSIIIAQLIGAIIFWKIDKWLFRHKII